MACYKNDCVVIFLENLGLSFRVVLYIRLLHLTASPPFTFQIKKQFSDVAVIKEYAKWWLNNSDSIHANVSKFAGQYFEVWHI